MPELNEDGVHVHIGSARTTGYRPNAVPASIRLCRRGTAGSAVSKLPVCHDVQQPLTVILAQTQMLQRQKSGRPRALLLAKSELVALTRQSVRERTPASPTSTSFCWRAPDHLPYVFDRFDRGANVVGRFAGTGIGLASARELAELHGARSRWKETKATAAHSSCACRSLGSSARLSLM